MMSQGRSSKEWLEAKSNLLLWYTKLLFRPVTLVTKHGMCLVLQKTIRTSMVVPQCPFPLPHIRRANRRGGEMLILPSP